VRGEEAVTTRSKALRAWKRYLKGNCRRLSPLAWVGHALEAAPPYPPRNVACEIKFVELSIAFSQRALEVWRRIQEEERK
jgi:hypothetical protein